MTEASCSTCRFWRQGDFKLGDGVRVGDCRRSPPRIVRELNPFADEGDHLTTDREINAYHATAFPVVAADDWCGEFDESPVVIAARLAEADARDGQKTFGAGYARALSPDAPTAGGAHLSYDTGDAW